MCAFPGVFIIITADSAEFNSYRIVNLFLPSLFIMLPSFKAVGGFLNRNRNKILIASVVAISVAIYMHYNSNEELLANNTNENDVEEESLDDDNNDGVKKRTESPLQINSPGNKARILLRLRREFDITAQCFLPTLRTKIMEVVDINESVRAIKELRTKSSEQNNEPAIQLWEEVKISAFQMMFVSSYMLCAMCILLRVQLCLLTRVSNRSGSAGNVGMDDGTQFDTAMFNLLVDNTFKHLYGSGLRTFSAMVKHRVMLDLKGWVVKEQGAVTFGELQQTVTSLRQAMETDLPATIQTIFIRKCAPNVFVHLVTMCADCSFVLLFAAPAPTALVGGIQPLNGLHNGNGTSGRDSPEATVQKLLDQVGHLHLCFVQLVCASCPIPSYLTDMGSRGESTLCQRLHRMLGCSLPPLVGAATPWCLPVSHAS